MKQERFSEPSGALRRILTAFAAVMFVPLLGLHAGCALSISKDRDALVVFTSGETSLSGIR